VVARKDVEGNCEGILQCGICLPHV
jgi:hypothetical protein